jgi:major type 1 subunit fimbrin (pilin)
MTRGPASGALRRSKRPRSAPARLARLALELGALAWPVASAHAATRTLQCAPGSFALLAPAPARIIVPASAGAQAAVWSGMITLGFSCTSNARGASLGGGRVVGGSTLAALVSTSGSADGLSVVSTGTPSLSLSSPGCALSSLSEKARRWTFGLKATAAGTCAGTLEAPVEFVRAGTALGADIAASFPLGSTSGAANWVVFPTAPGGVSSSLGLSSAVPLVSGGGCTVSPTALTVTLPQVSTSALTAPGQTAGATAFRFPLQSCLAVASGSYAVYASWSFSAVAGYPTVIANTAAGAAGKVGVQITDAAGTPVGNGVSSSAQVGSVSTAGAVAAQTFLARYYATGAATPGAVSATATYTLTYQ